MASPETLSTSQITRLKATNVRVTRELLGVETMDLAQTMELELMVRAMHDTIVFAIKSKTEPQSDAAGYSNDTHGSASRVNPESLS